MSADQVMSIAFFGGFAILFCWYVAEGLRAGQVKPGAVVYERLEQPVEYWSFLAWAIIVIATMLLQVVEAARDLDDSPAIPLLMLFIVGAPSVFELVRGLQTGSIRFGKMGGYSRREVPRRYWALFLAHALVAVAVAAIALWYLSSPGGKGGTPYQQVVEPVVRAARVELSAGPARGRAAPEFRNVRVDGKSGLVCGKAATGGRILRFFGASTEQGAKVRLDDDSSDFDRAWPRACGGPAHLPPQG